MIGQRDLLNRIDGQIERGKFPRFTILIGEKGSGKKAIAQHISRKMKTPIYMVEDTKADTIRDMIDTCYKVDLPMLYVIPDCDTMSSSAANALLKVTEEPPKNVSFILTCESIDNLLPTIKSRGVTYMLEPYSYEDLCDYIETQSTPISPEDEEFILEFASNIGEVQMLLAMDITEFREFVTLVIDNIAEVSDSNSFKIADRIALKGEDDKYDLRVFWKAFRSICTDKMRDDSDPLKYAKAIGITGDYLAQLTIRSINKQMLVDNWIISIRDEWV